METWDELVDEKYSDKDVEEFYFALMAFTLSDLECELGF